MDRAAPQACINVSGLYDQWGTPIAGGPLTFQGMPFSLDVMTGPYVSYNDRKKITQVQVEQRDDEELTFTFFTAQGMIAQRKYFPSQDVYMYCLPGRIVVRRSVQTKGEAARGTAVITHAFSKSEEGGLTVHMIIQAVDEYLFFFKKRRDEEYRAQFRALEP